MILTDIIPKAAGMLVLDENYNLIEASGVGQQHLADIPVIRQTELDGEGFAVLESSENRVIIYRQDKATMAVYTSRD
ncbi:LADA_0F14774g1_1 [Lachancea dasiensis]|uniref:LADA_0F14774g1_1 n=1 Tax=Lachancea dasiensis TaxID=1072105 RepID=A0A1G4JNF4_9SACH|nr:LADA_0F14774g1_1 [Lachancea dasiensis]